MRVFVISILFLLPISLLAQKIDNSVSYRNIESETYFRFHYDNDYFAATDENYTQGYNLELVSPSLEKNPINYLFIKPKASHTKYGLSLEHIGFTPNDYVSEAIQFGDRPFSTAIMLKSFTIATDTIRKTRISQSLSLGLIGPGAFGKEMQVGIHEATGNKVPGGWDNQIQNDVVINYQINYEKQIYQYNHLFALQAQSSVQLGTLFTNTSLGFNTTFGILNSEFTADKPKNKFQIYAYAQPIITVVGYDATLQGGLFNRDNPYTISSKGVERFTAQYNYGIVIKTKTMYFEYTRSAITREFESGVSAKWGGIRIGFTF
ncbi:MULTISPECIES: lipid A deacylase LpxR family protein [Winogradskyella]|uniref:lipid A deacylase LpxR family protein n=1 Tax=Winogradskyella TaxID=286104 RepID=UPI0015CDA8DD|nr:MULTISPECIES: lipid A deacylase LpxR family protein [Winogradskyella]QXP78182.1 lipid A deacylase LpxR family protein [Winogradskyella sp. HaHa_3_26]